MGHSKTLHKSYNHFNLNCVTFSDIIKSSSHQFDFGDIPNGPSKYDLNVKDCNTDAGGNSYMILTKVSKRYKVSPEYIMELIYIPKPYSIQDMKYITIDGKLHHQFNTSFIYMSTHNCTHFQ